MTENYRIGREGGVARVTLCNPERHNCFDDRLIEGLTATFAELGEADDVRVIVLDAEGKSFSAGADLNWMRRMAENSHEENLRDARGLARMLQTINMVAKPTVALVQGPTFGGGVGLAACCDIVIAGRRASFSLSEVKLGIIPATISPDVLAAIGPRAARRYMLTAERFDAETAALIGLVHQVVADEQLAATGKAAVETLLANGPNALVETKRLIFGVGGAISEETIDETARWIARIRATDEAREGMRAFLDKGKPEWGP